MTQKDPEGPRRTKKDPGRFSKLRQTSQADFAASSFSSCFSILILCRSNNFCINIISASQCRCGIERPDTYRDFNRVIGGKEVTKVLDKEWFVFFNFMQCELGQQISLVGENMAQKEV